MLEKGVKNCDFHGHAGLDRYATPPPDFLAGSTPAAWIIYATVEKVRRLLMSGQASFCRIPISFTAYQLLEDHLESGLMIG